MTVRIEPSWLSALQPEFDKPYFKALTDFVKQEYQTKTIYPPGNEIFNAFDKCPIDQVKVVIIGQDPYHEPHQAQGLCFSVNDGIQIPPSLVNIYKEINAEFGTPIPTSGNLMRWVSQGVFLLNATLTVEAHRAGSHQGKGWETFTDAVISTLNSQRKNVVYMLWGSYAQKKASLIDASSNLILKSAHPSPLSAYRGFFGNGHFKTANDYLADKGLQPIKW